MPLDGPSPPSLTGRLADARALRPAANWESSEQHYQSSSSFPHVEPGARRPRGARRAGAPLAPPIPRRRARPARKSQGPRAPRAARGKRAMCGGGGGVRQSGALLSSAAKGASRAATRARGAGQPSGHGRPAPPSRAALATRMAAVGHAACAHCEHGGRPGRLHCRPRPASQNCSSFGRAPVLDECAGFGSQTIILLERSLVPQAVAGVVQTLARG